MVKYQDAVLDRTFAALADPTRRALPAVMKHLDVLSDAGLIKRTKTGRIVACELTPEPMENAMNWLNRYLRFWSEQLDRLAAFVERESCPPNPKPPSSQASPSNVVSMRRPRKSSPRGRTPKKS
jgi:hypothetical protein